MGDKETCTQVYDESTLGYHSSVTGVLTWYREQVRGECQVGSLPGAVASQRLTEAPKGPLRLDGNQSSSAIAEACLTVRQTSRTGTKVGNSDPAVPNGRAVAQRIWGGRLPKSNGGAQRYAQIGWKPIVECNCRSVLDCETNKSNRDESREY